MALLSYRATPLSWCNLSPAELSMGRRLRCSLPQVQDNYRPGWPYLEAFQQQHHTYKRKQVIDFNSRHRAHSATPIQPDSDVWVTSGEADSRKGYWTRSYSTIIYGSNSNWIYHSSESISPQRRTVG